MTTNFCAIRATFLLDEIGIEGRERICAARVLILGAGGLGAPARPLPGRQRRGPHHGGG